MKNRVKNESDGSLWFDAIILLAVIGVVIFSINSVQAAPIPIDFDAAASGVLTSQSITDSLLALN